MLVRDVRGDRSSFNGSRDEEYILGSGWDGIGCEFSCVEFNP